jgi:hypothetical protein
LRHQLLLPTLLLETEVATAAQRLANLEADVRLLELDVHGILRAHYDASNVYETLEKLMHLQSKFKAVLDKRLLRLKLYSAFLLGEAATLENDLSAANSSQHKCGSVPMRSILETLSSSLDHLEFYRESLDTVERWEKQVSS